MGRVIRAADLFCGAGGTSTGLMQAAAAMGVKVELTAVNHWPVAIETHAANHPGAEHLCESLDNIDPRKIGELDLLMASPECTHHSVARGGRPINDQSRATAWHVIRWAEALRPKEVSVENVPEFQTWGPIGSNGQPLQSRRGETFRAWCAALESLGYTVESKVLTAADYGAATTRRRLFVRARLTGGRRRPVIWPEPSHAEKANLWNLPKWRAAREVIDWSLIGRSIFDQNMKLAEATLRRIAAGALKYWGIDIEPALKAKMMPLLTAEQLERLKPFLYTMTHGGRPGSLDHPFPTITGANRGELSVIEPLVMTLRNNMGARSAGEPLPTVTAGGNHHGVLHPQLTPFLATYYGDKGGQPRTNSIDAPIPTIPTENRFGVTTPFLIPFYGERQGQDPRTHSVDAPMPTIPATGHGKFAVVEGFVPSQASGGAARGTDKPMPTIVGGGGESFVRPFLIPYCSNGGQLARTAEQPLHTVTTRDRISLVEGTIRGYALDIRFRMLQPHELAAGQGFPSDYKFSGNRTEQVKQIGNAVEVNQARALCAAALRRLVEAAA